MDPIENLKEEHRFIERVLGSLETFSENLSGTVSDRETLRKFVDFFSGFVDTIHHGKEELYLFVKLAAYGFSRESGAIAAMLSEQGEGRDHLNALAQTADGSGPLSQYEKDLVQGHAQGYIVRILLHMKREDTILFPKIRQALSPDVIAELGREFEDFEAEDLAPGELERLRTLARSLEQQYPPDPKRIRDLPSVDSGGAAS